MAFTLFLTLSTSSCGDLKENNSESLKWMSETTEIQIPDNIENQEFYNNHEWGMIVKFQASKNIFENFCKTYNMTKLNENNLKMWLLNDIEGIPIGKQFIKSPSNYLTFSDCKRGNSWTLLAHEKSRTIWFEVLYPDNGGDIAPCKKDTVANTVYSK